MRPRRVIAAVFATVVVMAALAISAPSPAMASQATSNESVLQRLIAGARAQRELPPLHVHAALTLAARGHSRDMMRRQYFSHSQPGGAGCGARARRGGYATSGCRSWAVSEVIGWGVGAVGTPEAVFSSWMLSPYHRAIILGRRWHDVGIGCVSGTFRGASGSWMYTVDVGRRDN
jgi:uncharacterized protein YkwD